MRTLWLVGMGPGNPDYISPAARKALLAADVLIGAERLLDQLPEGTCGNRHMLTRASDIIGLLAQDSTWENAAVALSGDTGMFSGAKLLQQRAPEALGCTVRSIPAVGSASYFAAALGMPWQGWKTVSAHGVDCDVAAQVRDNPQLFLVTGGATPVQVICRTLAEAGLGKTRVFVGEQLSYPEEKITEGTVAELAEREFHPLSVMLCLRDGQGAGADATAAQAAEAGSTSADNAASRCETQVSNEPGAAGNAPACDSASAVDEDTAWPWSTHGIPDDLFTRGKVPMTKQEVRSVALSKLRVAPGETIYDIGAGTGSVTVELALLAGPAGRVIAIERNPEGCQLIEQNARKFEVGTIRVVEGTAPGCMVGLPVPDAAFIGGSGSNLDEIAAALLAANPRVRVCVTCVTLETVAQALQVLSAAAFEGFEAVCINASRSHALGAYNLMKAENPIYVICAQGAGAPAEEGARE
ncbi:MAG: precorrin-6y C5,15-methyltransferase (decarboxylating) subunit CbiE [Eggerthellaceae bacterium]